MHVPRRRVSTGGPGCVPLTRDWSQAPADVAVPAWRSHRTGTACPPKKAVREAASRLFHHTIIIEPGRPSRHPRSTKGSEPNGCGPTGAGCLTSPDQHTLAVMAGLGPATHVLRPACAAKTWIPGSSPGMTVRMACERLDKKSAGSPLPLVGRVERGVLAPYLDRRPLTPSLALSHKEGGEQRHILHPIPDRATLGPG